MPEKLKKSFQFSQTGQFLNERFDGSPRRGFFDESSPQSSTNPQTCFYLVREKQYVIICSFSIHGGIRNASLVNHTLGQFFTVAQKWYADATRGGDKEFERYFSIYSFIGLNEKNIWTAINK